MEVPGFVTRQLSRLKWAVPTLAEVRALPKRIGQAFARSRRAKRAAPSIPSSSLVAGKQTIDFKDDIVRNSLQTVLQLSSEERWRDHQLDERTLDNISLAKLVELICDLSPDVSKAVWDFLRLCNPGWQFKVLAPQTDSDTENAAGKAVLDEFITLLVERHGSLDVVINRLFLATFARGAFAIELVFGLDGRTAYELATPDPDAFTFRRVEDPILRRRWQLGQYQGQQFVPLEFPTIRYIPIDSWPGSPQGRAPISAALFSAIFLLGMLHDIRRVVSQQGWPRLDLELQLEAIAASLPDNVLADPEQFKKHVEDAISQVKTIYSNLEPDDTYIHTNVVKLNRPVGTVDANSLRGVDALIKCMRELTVEGLKSIPLLHGLNDGVGEANANRQWELHAAGIKSMQHQVESCLGSLFNLVLRARGIQARVDWKFAELRAAEMLRDAQTEKLKIDNEVRKFSQGWTTQDEGALAVTGHVAVEPEPRNPIGALAGINAGGGNPATAQPDPGANRGISTIRQAEALALLMTTPLAEPASREIADAEQWWRDNSDPEAAGLIDATQED